ncbi:MAG TPA: hypothetical protein VMU17_08045 [Elusimicrobiota bacterium]|nr:hypothetical protein [Elusimicrobiota bacterium]
MLSTLTANPGKVIDAVVELPGVSQVLKSIHAGADMITVIERQPLRE